MPFIMAFPHKKDTKRSQQVCLYGQTSVKNDAAPKGSKRFTPPMYCFFCSSVCYFTKRQRRKLQNKKGTLDTLLNSLPLQTSAVYYRIVPLRPTVKWFSATDGAKSSR